MTTTPLLLFQTTLGPVARQGDHSVLLEGHAWDALVNEASPYESVRRLLDAATAFAPANPVTLLPPIGSQEVWAAGVTYYRSRDARMDEAREAGGASFYDRVYAADRPELFFKATAHRVVGSGATVRVRRDSHWSVPEPELVLAVNVSGHIVGYTIGNDVSARDIEGENPLYLPQAKVYEGSCAIGPGLWLTPTPPPTSTAIRLEIVRDARTVFEGETTVGMIKRTFDDLVGYLTRELSFPTGCYLFTGTGIVPPDDFTLASGDEVRISIEPIGMLTNVVL